MALTPTLTNGLQARIMNVVCESILDLVSPDPLTSFYPVTSFGADLATTG